MGRLPASGGWVRLEVPAAQVGLAGKTVNGLAFTLYGGRAWWDRAGVRRAVHEVTKYYEFNGQRIARRQDGVLTYLHTDHLGSTLLATNSSGAMVGEHRYRAYGSRRGGDELATDHRFTSQKYDGTGLYYYNARYYDPALGTFISPDTIVPDPTLVSDYNRFAYTRGNPQKYSDPTGHETDKPENWPDWLPYLGDRPDGLTITDLKQWVAENNIPTTIGQQGGIDFSVRFFGGVSASVEIGTMFNWHSGELAYEVTTSGGGNVGFAGDLAIGGHLGVTAVAGAESIEGSIVGYSTYGAIDVEGELIGKVGINGITQQALSADPGSSILTIGDVGEPLIDPVFNRTVDSISLNVTSGIDPASTFADGGYSMGVSQTGVIGSVNVYSPLVSLYEWWSSD